MRKATIVSAALHAPGKPVANSFFDQKYNRDLNQFLIDQRNIRTRHFMGENQTTSDLILPAAEEALKKAGLDAKDLDLIIVATDTPDYISPSTASVVQHRLQAINAGSFDLNTACSGFVAGFDIAAKYIAADEHYQNILVVGAYGMSKHFDWSDYKVTSVFADGAGAVIVRPSTDETGVLTSYLFTDGQYHDHMGIYAGGTAEPTTHQSIEARRHQLQFLKKIPVETNAVQWPRIANLLLDRIHRPASEVRQFFLTQININSIYGALEALHVPRERSHNIMDRFGYTGGACIPMAIADATAEHKLKRGDLVILLGSGGGMSMAAIAMTWSYDT